MIDEHQVDTVLYTDGSCKGGSEGRGFSSCHNNWHCIQPGCTRSYKEERWANSLAHMRRKKRAFVEAFKMDVGEPKIR